MQIDSTALQQRFFLLPLSAGEQDGEPVYCLFTQNQVVEVLGQKTVYPVPFSPDHVQGFIQWHEGLVPVVDVDVLCGLADKKAGSQARQLQLLRTGQIETTTGEFLKLALVCTSTVLTFKLTERDAAQTVAVEQVPVALADQDLVRGFFRLRGYRVALLDFDTIAQGTHGLGKVDHAKDESFAW